MNAPRPWSRFRGLTSTLILATAISVSLGGCGGDGGSDATGGGGASSTGSGGRAPGSGGAGSGGATSSGGTIGSGGANASGGRPGSGGGSASGGTTTGGMSGSGGGINTSGGQTGSGGANTGAMGGAGGSSGAGASGGTGGTGARGGMSGEGGMRSTGGVTGTGGLGSGGAGGADCHTPPAASALIGWATSGSGTTGGGTGTPVVVTTAAQLTSNISGTAARVIHVSGNISGSFNIGSNKTIIGVCGARIQGHLGLGGSSNVIVRNLTIVGNNCSDSPQDCSSGADAIGVTSAAHHLWFDHLDVSDGSDGNLDITQGSDFVTVSWTKFSYSTKRSDPDAGASGHRFSNLIGASDTDPADPGHLNVTYHHCWWAANVDQRMPRTRRGNIHVLNNLFTSSGNSYCTNAGQDAKLLVEGNVYSGVNRPLEVTANGNMRSLNNLFQGTSGTMTAGGTGFTPSYSYQPDATADLEAKIRSGAGPR